MAGISIDNKPKATTSANSDSSKVSTPSASGSSIIAKTESVSSDRQASDVNKVDINSSKAGDASKRISNSQFANDLFKASSETSVGALAQKINDDGNGNVDASAVKQSVQDIVNRNSSLKDASKDLDPSDPNYSQKLADLKIKEGETISLPTSQTTNVSDKNASNVKNSNDSGSPTNNTSGGSSPTQGSSDSGETNKTNNTTGASKHPIHDKIGELVQAILQAITAKDSNAASQLLSQIESMISKLESSSGGKTSGTISDGANQALNNINSGKSLSGTDQNQIVDLLSSGSSDDKIAVLKAIQSQLQNVVNQSGFTNTGSSDPLTASMNNQGIYNMAGLNINGSYGGIGNLKTSGNVNVYSGI